MFLCHPCCRGIVDLRQGCDVSEAFGTTQEALGPLLFDDQELAADRWTRDPVAQAEPSDSATRKKVERTTPDGFPVHSFDTLLKKLGTLCRNRCRIQADPSGTTFTQDTQPSELQARVFELLGL